MMDTSAWLCDVVGGSAAGADGGLRERRYVGVPVQRGRRDLPLPRAQSSSPGGTSVHGDGR